MRDVFDVDAAGRDLGGDQDVDLVTAEGAQRLLARALAEVAVDRAGRETAVDEFLRELRGGALGLGEDDGAAAAARLQDPCDNLGLIEVVGAVDDLADVLLGDALVLGIRGADVRGLGHVPAGHGDDGAGHGGGEQQRLAHRGRGGDQRFDVGQEAEVEHFVGLVEHHDLDVLEDQELLAVQVDQPARGADNDLDAALQRLDLRLVGPAAIDGDDARVALLRRGGEVAGDLDGEFAGGHDDEGLRCARDRKLVVAGVIGADDALQGGDAEAKGLAGSGLGLADDVVAAQGDRQGHRLDGEGVEDPGVGQRLHNVGADVEVGEGLGDLLVGFLGGDERVLDVDGVVAVIGKEVVRVRNRAVLSVQLHTVH
ncbi:MAG: hypothetical protein AVDCRST_MAG83-2530 [uncultured Arthrobacter sp.]|uniref:Uncharacterized protein n=1 Tax=uncultured Arthrobacter sp. TaxID=114050 RepID=A0A6J4IS29_9MICC|nr:MAG: hypothetical protein AVDCRST_MAG83-2530 [uncultured Arthrobacter sp.]